MRISESEMELMKLIWKNEGESTAAGLMAELQNDWQQTTVLNFLKRLVNKGALSVRREGKTNYYTPLVTEQEYKKEQTKGFLSSIHSGSVRNFLTALYGGEKPSREEIDELKQWLDEQ